VVVVDVLAIGRDRSASVVVKRMVIVAIGGGR
jgi:hypothetical protein